MEEKKKNVNELCAITKEFAQKKLKEMVENPDTKAILDEYFMWVNAINAPVQIIEEDSKDENPKDSE